MQVTFLHWLPAFCRSRAATSKYQLLSIDKVAACFHQINVAVWAVDGPVSPGVLQASSGKIRTHQLSVAFLLLHRLHWWRWEHELLLLRRFSGTFATVCRTCHDLQSTKLMLVERWNEEETQDCQIWRLFLEVSWSPSGMVFVDSFVGFGFGSDILAATRCSMIFN